MRCLNFEILLYVLPDFFISNKNCFDILKLIIFICFNMFCIFCVFYF